MKSYNLMLLITYKDPKQYKNLGIILIFGLGLVGRSTFFSLQKYIAPSTLLLPYSWDNFEKQLENKKLLLQHLKNLKCFINHGSSYISIIWSAGKGGFSADKFELSNEIISFKNTVDFAEVVQTIFPDTYHSFHLISSAGGLFEGQCNVGIDSIPNPKRPYGELKMEQENYLLGKKNSISKFVYRPSSIYGFAGYNRRLGLIPTLIQNAIQYKVSNIFGGMDTLRDYIFVNDIGDFVANNIFYPSSNTSFFTLATGKPSTILEIIRKIESIIGRKLYVRYEASDVNSANNSYSKKILPNFLDPTDIETGIRKTYASLILNAH